MSEAIRLEDWLKEKIFPIMYLFWEAFRSRNPVFYARTIAMGDLWFVSFFFEINVKPGKWVSISILKSIFRDNFERMQFKYDEDDKVVFKLDYALIYQGEER